MIRVPQWLPAAAWINGYRRAWLPGDLTAGAVVAVMLVPQAMAYALLAELPPQVGLYACLLPLVAYALLGSSRTLAVGPVAVVSLMVAATIGELGVDGDARIAVALTLALLSGLMLIAMGLARLGFITQYLSHPVLHGFMAAAALLIAFSQARHLLGLDAGANRPDRLLEAVVSGGVNPATAALGAASLLLLWFSRGPLPRLLRRAGVGEALAATASRAGPLLAVVAAAVAVTLLDLHAAYGVRIVGEVPAGLPSPSAPPADPDLWRRLLLASLLIAVVGFLESVSVARSLAARRRQRVDANRELIGLGAANVAAAFSNGYPVTGGLSRSLVNDAAGAVTPLASLVTAALVALVLALFTPLLHNLPDATLAAIIILAVINLIDLAGARRVWRYDRADGAAMAVTAVTVLSVGIEAGIVAGAALSLLLYLWRTSRPHVAVVGRVPGTEHYRNVLRHAVITSPAVLAVRVDESLYFPNSAHLEDRLLQLVAEQRQVRHLVLICSAVNAIDASALETLETLVERLREGGVTLHLAEVKGPVMDRLGRSDLIERLSPGRVFLSTHEAMRTLDPETFGG